MKVQSITLTKLLKAKAVRFTYNKTDSKRKTFELINNLKLQPTQQISVTLNIGDSSVSTIAHTVHRNSRERENAGVFDITIQISALL